MDRDSGAAVSRFGVARGKRTNRAELEKAHRSGAGCGVGRRRNNGLIGGGGGKELLGRTRTERLTGAAQNAVSAGVERTD